MRLIRYFWMKLLTTVIDPLSLHDALPICLCPARRTGIGRQLRAGLFALHQNFSPHPRAEILVEGKQSSSQLPPDRSEEHTSELQSRPHLVCRLLLEKKKK